MMCPGGGGGIADGGITPKRGSKGGGWAMLLCVRDTVLVNNIMMYDV